ncbi:MAG: GIY-YIG nuclease family protein [Erythrobacter sp.]|uniref:GIY-YIG nuclease family protein n=1 Tax=Erythrobacter sp. TaxID=1042 RepID=UPI0025F05DEE|nr:GIY-YIG nuclease family protein [Erythrobacter sp.]MCM0000969.1 GIY-YIG nuclease family protein [Erythrobacter sp.]
MERETRGGWVYIMTNRYRGTLYVGSTTDLAARIFAHREGRGSEFCAEHGLTRLVWAEYVPDIVETKHHERRVKRWHRDWKIALIEKTNPNWDDLFDQII